MSTPTAAAPVNTQPSLSDEVLGYLDRGLALPRKFYTDGDLYALELQAVFGRQWLYAGHVSQVPNAGDYLKLDIGDESAIVVRDRDGEIHALLNVCRHRGARLVDEPCGKLRRLVCPYHQWSYRHDGTLAGAPRMPESFDKSQFPLRRVHSAIWNGLIFVNFAGEPEDSLASLLGDSSQLMEPFDIASAKIAHTEIYEVAANWKLVWENSQECYHCNANHPEFIRTFDLSAMDTPDVAPVRSFTDDRRMQFGSLPLKSGAVSLTMTGEPASRLLLGMFSGGLESCTAATHLKPGFAAVFSPDYGIVFTDTPTGVDSTQVTVQWFVHQDAVEGVDFQIDDVTRVWDQTNRQDWELCRLVQQGVRSGGFEPGPLSLDETSVAGFYYSYARMMSAAGL